MMCGNGFQDAAHQSAGFERAMIGNGDVKRSVNRSRQADMGTFLP